MSTLATAPETLSGATAAALIVGLDAQSVPVAHSSVPAEWLGALAGPASALDASGAVGKVTTLPGSVLTLEDGTSPYGRVVLVGVGDASNGDLRTAAGAASRACGKRPASVVVALPAVADDAQVAVAEGVLLGSYEYTDYKTAVDLLDMVPTTWTIVGASQSVLDRASLIAGAVVATRDLVNTPPSDLYPESFAAIAVDLAQEHGCTVKVWDPADLEAAHCGGILGVGQGSSRLPRMVRIGWEPAQASQTIALVGKGITFDTGGISLKPSKPMETMKSDMAGAAAVLHLVVAAAKARLSIGVVGWLCLAENMPSSTAQRPSDVLRTHSGMTVEVMNTDAEGRLVLADGLAHAVEENPALVIDIATLTGAQGMALGTRTSAVMGTDEARAEVIESANAVNEPMWPMPLPDHLREAMDSKIADISNMGETAGGMLTAGLFLKEFVGDTPWAHLDIARPSFNEGGAYGFTLPGGTGSSVRALFELIERRAKH